MSARAVLRHEKRDLTGICSFDLPREQDIQGLSCAVRGFFSCFICIIGKMVLYYYA